jgi:hypothetical protein
MPAEGGLIVEMEGNQPIPPGSPHRRRFSSSRTASTAPELTGMVSAGLLGIGARP